MFTDGQAVGSELPVNVVVLAVIAGVIGLVLTGFTGWHVSLAVRNLTTIECLEKTRYLTPIRKTLDRQRQGYHPPGHPPHSAGQYNGIRDTLHGYGQQFIDIHANSIPGITRAEEGEERISPNPDSQPRHPLPNGAYDPVQHQTAYTTPAQQSLYHSYEESERARERDRYQEYLDERDSEKLPNAFDLGWKRNLIHLFGPTPWLWFLPVCNTSGDGWTWEPSQKWVKAKSEMDARRLAAWEEEQRRQQESAARNTRFSSSEQRYYYPEGYSEQGPGRYAASAPALQQHGTSSGPGPGPGTGPVAGSAPRNISVPVGGKRYHETDERPMTGVSMKTLAPMSPRPRPGEVDYDEFDEEGVRYSTSSDEDGERRGLTMGRRGRREGGREDDGDGDEWRDWD